jgi:signal transduction histidine kinase
VRLVDLPRPAPVDLLIAGALTLLAQLEITQYGLGTSARVASLIITGSMALRGRAPVAVAVLAASVQAGQALVLDPVPQVLGNGLALLIASYSVVAAGSSAAAATLGLAALAGSFIVFERAIGTPGAAAGDAVMCGGATAVGWYVARRRTAHEARLAEAQAQVEQAAEEVGRSLAEERRRIARELHDVVSHAITVVVLQARGGRAVLADHPDQTRAALDAIEESAQQALAEMRRLVVLLREPADDLAPQPRLSDLPELLGSLQPAEVALTVRGQPAVLTPGAELTAFRVVQEALTNALRHAPGQPVTVDISHEPQRVSIAVCNPLSTPGSHRDPGTGHGLVGLRERVSLYGGSLDAVAADGRWLVLADLPVESETADSRVA